MRLSIRSRLTVWYTAVVVAILLTGGIVGSLAQARLALQGLDDDLTRTMATLVRVLEPAKRPVAAVAGPDGAVFITDDYADAVYRLALAAAEPVNPAALAYINRLSDFLFVISRHMNNDGNTDVLWQPGQNR